MEKKKVIKKVWIEQGCMSCGACEFVAPEVFSVTDVSHIKDGADLKKYSDQIMEAANVCPAEVIKFEEEEL